MLKNKIQSIRNVIQIFDATLIDKRPVGAYVGGWLGKHNLGDEALFHAFQYLFTELHLLQFDGGRLINLLSRMIPLFRIGFLGGGTLIGQHRYFLEIAKKFLDSHNELIIFGTGVEDSFFWPGETTLRDWLPVLKRCRFIGVRGPISAEQLADIGIKQVQVVGDPVLAFATEEINPAPIPKSIGINIGTSDGKLWGSEEQLCSEITKLAKIAKKAGWSIKWFVVWPKDLEITKQAAIDSDTAEEIIIICNDYNKFMERVRPMTAFVGMKLHATLLATCMLTPSIMIEYRPKCLDYMRSIGQEALNFRTDSIRAVEIWEIVSSWNSNYQAAAKDLAKGILPLRNAQRKFAKELTADV